MWSRVRALLPALMILSLVLFSGCADSDTDEAMKPSTGDAGAMGKEESLESKGVGISEGRTSEGMLPVYFDFDSSDIRQDQVSRIQVNADFMKGDDGTVRIEGNCDPRGTNEYNMALGERRALSAKKYLVNLGVPEERLTTISYGEERLLVHGQDELSYAQNRRDDFVIAE
ncbi:OmpA family protein [Desulfofustis glycolicus]|uniref:Peptidoglycan-associated lipoprotein n=1 Tax=Desulfofustis glycolicus DSM 9705 TaxID=1121409 RepID=A0A1M5V9R0_9BACT|nr:OmpA family protein [Desulfofustis glycolicus]MCB2218206.1 OmpA family protein [Desulfobulbaceae bacterium]SHH71966.1 peptidoglycan-associated lipoprotein [Desulfofustis glycolicus DSM 9705]